MIPTETKTDEMLNAAQQLDVQQSQGDMVVLPNSSHLSPSSAAVFAEPIVPAQPMLPSQRRRVPDFLQRMKVLAQMAGEDYRYSFPVKSKQGKKTIEGGTIKMANDLVREYGNCMVDVRVIEQGDSHVFYARFIDYETGFCLTRPFRQRKNQTTMGDDPQRAQDIVFQIGASKAIRNVILNALGTFADFTYEEAKKSLVEKVGKDLGAWRGKIIEGCQQRGYDLPRIENSVGKKVGEWLATDIARVVAELKSISDGMATFDDLYPNPNAVGDLNAEFNSAGKTPAADKKGKGKKAETPHDPVTGEVDDKAEKKAAQREVQELHDTLEKMAPEARVQAFLDVDGMASLERAGRTDIVDDAFTKLGINLPPRNPV